jgi:flagellar biogenesis protein FliO
MPTSQWTVNESLILAINIAVITFVIWALRRRIRTKLDEVETRQEMSIMGVKDPENDTSE